MLLLAIETCLGPLSVAVAHAGDGRVLAQREEPAGASHAELLMPLVRDVLGDGGGSFRDVSRIAITLGPGSFTGVRTGIAAARAFRLGLPLDIVGIGSLALLAAMARRDPGDDDRPLLAVMDARRGRVYAQLFADCGSVPLSKPEELSPEHAYELAASHGDALVTGSGAGLVAQRGHGESRPLALRPSLDGSPAVVLARLAPGLAPLCDVAPLYIRSPDAKPSVGPMVARIS